jgi:hypothetical protein
LSWRDDQALQSRSEFRGFEILSKGRSNGFGLVQDGDRIPELFVRGQATYSAKLNAENPTDDRRIALMNVLACSTFSTRFAAGFANMRFQRVACFKADRKTAWV